ncbi:hypothetical protein M2272_003056 [Mycobacterium frederiksbergense]|uniref:WXG100 family type VII secretion target n=1 Tax=Mycolicibacterium frederiksbergense TaxID=117567 RepID=A0ABT6L0I5_9MYCO|nr:hypothetical protein [Mycolicibacterium frederiksbergense]MDH6196413.1 hypothetical protein [Mycolicibacterium frederiksbergense]
MPPKRSIPLAVICRRLRKQSIHAICERFVVSIPDIEKWDPNILQQVLDTSKKAGNTLQRLGDGLDGTKKSLEGWRGPAADAWQEEHGKVRTKVDEQIGQAGTVGSIASTAIADVTYIVNQLKAIRAMPEQNGMKIMPDGSVVDPQAGISDPQVALTRLAIQQTAEEQLKALIAQANATEVEVANALRAAVGDAAKIQPVPSGAPSAPTAKQIEQKKNQTEVFQKAFGRPPTSPADWKTAETLDPHSYSPKTHGTPPNIVVGRIKPVPGQGVVQANMFIPGKDAIAPSIDLSRPMFPHGQSNAGDNRGFNPNAPSEANRVQVTVDYENGLVTVRQNPSVNLATGEVKPGTPDVAVTQKPDGGVLIKYNAADPFSPGGQGLAKALNYSVNGEIAVQPGTSGPSVGGNVTTFPSLEVTHTAPTGQVASVLQSAPTFATNEFGPMVGLLPPTKAIGDVGLLGDFNSYFPAPQGGLTAPLGPSHLPGAIPITPPLSIVPPTLTSLGPVSDIPDIPVRTPVHIPK